MRTVQLLKSEEFEIGTTDKNGNKIILKVLIFVKPHTKILQKSFWVRKMRYILG